MYVNHVSTLHLVRMWRQDGSCHQWHGGPSSCSPCAGAAAVAAAAAASAKENGSLACQCTGCYQTNNVVGGQACVASKVPERMMLYALLGHAMMCRAML
jgi:hypothetical protein